MSPSAPVPGRPADLDALRVEGDPLADGAVAAYFAEIAAHDPGDLFGRLVRHVTLPPEDQVPAIRRFLAEAGRRPDWVDDEAVRRGQRFFDRLAAHHFAALYLASLPNSYAAANGVQVLRTTGRLQTDVERRPNETAQFLMDASVEGAMLPGGLGLARVLHVRLMHAAVRWLIMHDPAVAHLADLAPPQVEPEVLVWSASWGVPANQEDLVGTWLAFTVVVYDALDASGVHYDDADVVDHLHLWRLVAHHLGIDPALVPLTREDATELRDRIFGRQQAPSAAGRAMSSALVQHSRERMPRWSWALIPTAFRHVLGDPVSDMLGLPPANWTRHLFPVLNAITRVATRGQQRHGFHVRLSEFIGRHLMEGILTEVRHGSRPGFEIPEHLARS